MGSLVTIIIFSLITLNAVKTIINCDHACHALIGGTITTSIDVRGAMAHFYDISRTADASAAYAAFGDNAEALALKPQFDTLYAQIEADFADLRTAIDGDPFMDGETKRELGGLLESAKADFDGKFMTAANFIYASAGSDDHDKDELHAALQELMSATDAAGGSLEELFGTVKDSWGDTFHSYVMFLGGQISKLYVILAAAVAFSVFLVLFIGAIIKKPAVRAQKAMQEIAGGNFVAIRTNDRDEIGRLTNGAADIVDIFRSMIHEIHENSKALEAGNIGARLDAGKFKGEYAAVAEAINETVEILVADAVFATNLTKEIAAGNFAMEIPEFPGDKRVMTEAFRNIQTSVKKIQDDIGKLADRVADGDFTAFADDSAYEGGWRELAVKANRLVEAVKTPIYDINGVLGDFARGNLGVRIDGRYKGSFADIVSATNATIATASDYVGEISGILEEIASRNLDIAITREFIGDYAPIKRSLEHILNTFNDVLSVLSATAKNVADDSGAIAEQSWKLAQNSDEQSRAVNELDQTVEIISNSISVNAENAQEADLLATAAKESSIRGNNEMNTMLRSMEEINDASESIGRIIKVIDDIASQTNLLALNAAVEAARAGEHGKGFAVVAEEVRNLAKRSSEAAKETASLVENSRAKTKEGGQIAVKSADSLSEIISHVETISERIASISEASRTQSGNIGKFGEKLAEIVAAANNNTAISEESAADSEQLSGLSAALREKAAAFKLRRLAVLGNEKY
jgi:methyl-accepting chemotaxis protein